jgi:hypothetical protein
MTNHNTKHCPKPYDRDIVFKNKEEYFKNRSSQGEGEKKSDKKEKKDKGKTRESPNEN